MNTDAIGVNDANIAQNVSDIAANTVLINQKTAANKALIEALQGDLDNLKTQLTYMKEEFFVTNDTEFRLYTGSETATGFELCLEAGQTAEIVVNVSISGGKVDTDTKLFV